MSSIGLDQPSSTAIIVTDPLGTILYWNEGSESLYGWASDDAVGRTVGDLLVPRFAADQAERIFGSLNAGTPWSGRFVVQHRDGRPVPIRIVDTPVSGPDGQIVAIVGVAEHAPLCALLLEPNDSARTLITDLLEDEGVAVHVAEDAVETLSMSQCVRYDLVIAEARVGGDVSADVLYEQLTDAGYDGPFLLVSGWPEAPEIARRLGVPYVAKPFDLTEFGQAVRTAVDV